MKFYETTLYWQWMRLPGDVFFGAAAVLMAFDFIVKLEPLYGAPIFTWARGLAR